MKTFALCCLLLSGCISPIPGLGDTSDLELIASVDGSPITFAGLHGDAPDTAGYRLVARLQAGEAGTSFALRINAVDWGYFYWRTINLDGVLSADTTTPPTGSGPTAPWFGLHPRTLDVGDDLTVTFEIPVSGQAGDGFNSGIDVQWTATAGPLGLNLNGSGTTAWTAEVTQVDVFPASGSMGPGTRAVLYRTLR